MRIAAVLLVLPLVSCTMPGYDNPKRVGRIESLREARDLCLIQNVPHFDDGRSDPAKIGGYVAMSCSNETTKLVDLAIPYPSRQARDAFQEEAARRATGYVLTARRMESDAIDRQRQPAPQQPMPQQPSAPLAPLSEPTPLQ